MPRSDLGEIIRVTKIDYSPHQFEPDAYNKELLVKIWGVNKLSKKVELTVHGCKPRFWTVDHPDDVDIPESLKPYIIKVRKQGVSFYTGEELYCIYIKYPYGNIIHKLRDCFDMTYQADVPFAEAVRFFYGIRSHIQIPRGKYDLHINDVKPVTIKSDIPTNNYVIDIETGDTDGFADPKNPTQPIRCLTLLNKRTLDVYHLTTAAVKPHLISKVLQTQSILDENVNHSKPIPIFEGEIKTYSFTEGDEEERERTMFVILKKLIKLLGINNIEEYGNYDVAYIHQRANWKNKLIMQWNKRNGGGRKFYPKKVFHSVNNLDVEEFYKKFITGSAKASGRNALEWMSQEELKYGKIQRDMIDKMYEDDPEFLSAYNIWDCVLPDRCMKKCGDLMDIHQSVCDMMGCGLHLWKLPMIQWESAIMHRLKGERLLYSTMYVPRDKGMEVGGKTEGYLSGLHEHMIELDNSGEYNAVVMTCRMAHETILDDDEEPGDRLISQLPSGRRYYLDTPAIIPDMLVEYTEAISIYKRKLKEAKKQREEMSVSGASESEMEVINDLIEKYDRQKYILKSASLAGSGLYGTAKYNPDKEKAQRPFRLAHGGIASDITEGARYHLLHNKEFIETHPVYWNRDGNDWEFTLTYDKDRAWDNRNDYQDNLIVLRVLAMDTDSNKCKSITPLPKLDDDEMLRFLTVLGDFYSNELNGTFDAFSKITFGVNKHFLRIKLDAVYKRYFTWGARKHYVYKDFQGEIKYKGLKIVKRDVMVVQVEFTKKFFEIVMKDQDFNETKSELSELIRIYERDILSGKYHDKCGEVRGVHTETTFWESMKYSNTVFGKNFKIGSVGVFFNVKGVKGKPRPKNGRVALEYGDKVIDFNLVINYDEVLRKIRDSMKKIIAGLEPGATWVSLRDNIQRSTFGDDDPW